MLDQTARDSAAAAQTAADSATTAAAAAQSDIDAHEANHPSGGQLVVLTRRRGMRRQQHKPISMRTRRQPITPMQGRRTAAANAQSAIEDHEGTPHNTDTTARDAAANAQSAIEDHEGTPHNTDTTARTAAAAARARADDAYRASRWKS